MKNIENVPEFIMKMITEVTGVPQESIGLETKIEDVCKDSIQIFSLIMAIEKEIGLHVAYGDLMHIETVGDAVSFMEKLMKK